MEPRLSETVWPKNAAPVAARVSGHSSSVLKTRTTLVGVPFRLSFPLPLPFSLSLSPHTTLMASTAPRTNVHVRPGVWKVAIGPEGVYAERVRHCHRTGSPCGVWVRVVCTSKLIHYIRCMPLLRASRFIGSLSWSACQRGWSCRPPPNTLCLPDSQTRDRRSITHLDVCRQLVDIPEDVACLDVASTHPAPLQQQTYVAHERRYSHRFQFPCIQIQSFVRQTVDIPAVQKARFRGVGVLILRPSSGTRA